MSTTLASPDSGAIIIANARLTARLLAQGWTETEDPAAPGIHLITQADLDDEVLELATAIADGDADTLTSAQSYAVPKSATYTAYTPTLSQNGTRTTSTMVARYIQVGKLVHAWGQCVLSNAGTAGNAVGLTLPVAVRLTSVNSAHFPIGVGYISDADVGNYLCHAIPDGPGLVFYSDLAAANATANRAGVTPSFALASGDIIAWDITYEAA